jgi:hypothetical protein
MLLSASLLAASTQADAPHGMEFLYSLNRLNVVTLAATSSMPLRNRKPAELDEPRLVGMKGEPEACEPGLKIGKEPLCLVLMLKADDLSSA